LYPSDADVLYETQRLNTQAWNASLFEMFRKTSGSFRAHQLSAEIFEIQGRYAEAAGEYRKAIEENQVALNLHFRRGRVLLLESHAPGNLAQARVAALSPDFPEALEPVAQARMDARQYGAAIARLERVVRLQPDDETAHYRLMMTYRDAGRTADATGEQAALDKLRRAPEGEFTNFLKRLGEKVPKP